MSFRPNLLTKKHPFRVHLSIDSFHLSKDKCTLFEKELLKSGISEEFAVFYRRGARNSSGTQFVAFHKGKNASSKKEKEKTANNRISFDSDTESSSSNMSNGDTSTTGQPHNSANTLSFASSFQFKVTMFQKKDQIKKKMLYLILQRRQAGAKNSKIVNEAKISLDLSGYTLKMLQSQAPTQCFKEVLSMPKWGELHVGITMENITMLGGSMDTTMMMTTMDETTDIEGVLMDEEDLEEMIMEADSGELLPDSSDAANQAAIQSMEETRRLRDKIRELTREVQSLTIQNEQKLMKAGSHQDIAKLEREKNTQQYLTQELKTELDEMRQKYEDAQSNLKKQLQDEREKSKSLKDGFEKQIKSKEEEIASLRDRIDQLVNIPDSEARDDAQTQELHNQIGELKKQYHCRVKEFDEFKTERERSFEAEKKKDALLIKELRKELQSYQRLVRRDNQLIKTQQQDENHTHDNKAKVKEIEMQLEQLRESRLKQEEREKEYISEIEELKQKTEQFELDKLSVELAKEEAISEFKSKVLQKEKETLRLQDDLDERIEQEEKLVKEVKDLERKIASTLTEKANFEEKMKADLEYARERMKELEESLKQQSRTQMVKQGIMVKQGRVVKNWKERWFSLNGAGHITYALSEDGDVRGGIVVKHAQALKKKSFSMFKLQSNNRLLLCYPKSQQEYAEWVEAFKRVGITVQQDG